MSLGFKDCYAIHLGTDGGLRDQHEGSEFAPLHLLFPGLTSQTYDAGRTCSVSASWQFFNLKGLKSTQSQAVKHSDSTSKPNSNPDGTRNPQALNPKMEMGSFLD